MDPRHVGKYRIDGVLGRGAMGIVYLGFDPGFGRPVAIKTLRKELLAGDQSHDAVERFRREARAAGRLSHPNIVTVHDFGEDATSAYLVCEYVAGPSLEQWLAEHGRAGVTRTVGWISQLLGALEYVHAHGLVHRDIKPANILLARDQSIKLTDFGIAYVDASDLTQVGLVLGTPSSMAPEQIRREPVDRRTDVFAVGVLLYRLLTGTKAFSGSAEAAMQQILDDTPPVPSKLAPDIPAAFDAVVARALAKHPRDRFASAAVFLAALRAAARRAGVRGTTTEDTSTPDAGIEATRLAPRRGVAGMPAAHPPAAWNDETLRQVESSLRQHVGPIAGLLVKQASTQSTTLPELASLLADVIPAERGRARFLASMSAGTVRTFNAIAPVTPAPTLVTPMPATPAAPAPRAALDEATITRVHDRLAVLIGPMAILAVRRALPEADSVQSLVQRVAQHVPDNNARLRLLREFGVSTAAAT